MEKIEIIARRVLGWKMNSLDRWYNHEDGTFIEGFQPEENLEHAMLIVHRFEKFGFTYTAKGNQEVCFNSEFINGCGTGNTLAEAITNAAYNIAENNPISSEWF